MLELSAGNNVILNTPTGSGKSLVALALQFKSLCHVLGPGNVGMITGDATVTDREFHFASWFHPAPASTKPLLSRSAASNRQTGTYPSRGAAWQIPLLTRNHVDFAQVPGLRFENRLD